jgi:hypothetical protein
MEKETQNGEENLFSFGLNGASNIEVECKSLNSQQEEEECSKDVCADTTDFNISDISEDDKKGDILFYVQAIVLVIVVVACIINLSLENGDQTAWASMLSGCLGLLLPQPQRINFKK